MISSSLHRWQIWAFFFRHSKQKVIHEGQHRITGLNFKTHNKNQVLFVATEGEIICITLLPKDKEQKVAVESVFDRSLSFILIFVWCHDCLKQGSWCRWLLEPKSVSNILENEEIISRFSICCNDGCAMCVLLENFQMVYVMFQNLLDSHGCSLHCSVMSDFTQYNQFVIGRPDVSFMFRWYYFGNVCY